MALRTYLVYSLSAPTPSRSPLYLLHSYRALEAPDNLPTADISYCSKSSEPYDLHLAVHLILSLRFHRVLLFRIAARVPHWPVQWPAGDTSVGRMDWRTPFSTRPYPGSWLEGQTHFKYQVFDNIDGLNEESRELSEAELGPHETLDRRIYILGIGNVGKFVAHSLVGIPNRPPITLLLHRQSLLHEWKSAGEEIDIVSHGASHKRKGFQVELTGPPACHHPDRREMHQPIQNLIVAVKSPQTTAALSVIAHRLNRHSTIVFLHNGMGVLEEINDNVFPDIDTRPNYMLGILSHGLHEVSTFKTVHAGIGTTALGLFPRGSQNNSIEIKQPQRSPALLPASSRYLLRTLTRSPALVAVGFHPTDLLQLQIEKLAINATINPLTVIFDCRNGELRFNLAITRVMRLLLSETSLVIRSLPEIQDVPNLLVRFSPDRLEHLVVSIAERTASNNSSMLQDVRLGKTTEVDYINGYIVRRGEELGIRCVVNYTLMQMVKGKSEVTHKKVHC